MNRIIAFVLLCPALQLADTIRFAIQQVDLDTRAYTLDQRLVVVHAGIDKRNFLSAVIRCRIGGLNLNRCECVRLACGLSDVTVIGHISQCFRTGCNCGAIKQNTRLQRSNKRLTFKLDGVFSGFWILRHS